MLVLTAMILRRGATAVLTFAFAALSQTPAGKDLSYLDGIPEKHRLAPAEVARLETNLIRNPGDLSSRARLLIHYFQHIEAQPRMKHIIWVVRNHPDSKLAGSPFVRVTPDSDTLGTRGDYEAVRALWLTNIVRRSGNAAVLGNAAVFFETEEPARAAELLKRSWSLDPENKMRRAALVRFYTRLLVACESDTKACPDPIWLMQAKSDLESLTAH
jgi:hypothetical protein